MVWRMMPISWRRAGLELDAAVVDELREGAAFLERYPLTQIGAPTLVIHSRDDTAAPFEWGEHTAATIPGARLVGYDRGGHMLLGHFGDTRSIIRSFLGQLSRESP